MGFIVVRRTGTVVREQRVRVNGRPILVSGLDLGVQRTVEGEENVWIDSTPGVDGSVVLPPLTLSVTGTEVM